eukprot:349655-Chlamydomonas_euryale.AAC.9
MRRDHANLCDLHACPAVGLHGDGTPRVNMRLHLCMCVPGTPTAWSTLGLVCMGTARRAHECALAPLHVCARHPDCVEYLGTNVHGDGTPRPRMRANTSACVRQAPRLRGVPRDQWRRPAGDRRASVQHVSSLCCAVWALGLCAQAARHAHDVPQPGAEKGGRGRKRAVRRGRIYSGKREAWRSCASTLRAHVQPRAVAPAVAPGEEGLGGRAMCTCARTSVRWA